MNVPNNNNQILDEKLNQVLRQKEKSISNYFINRYKITILILGVIFIVGLFAILTMPKEAEPEVEVPFAVVSIPYPGANPIDVEELAVKKVEEKIKNLDNLKSYNSSSGIGFGSVFVEFTAEADLKDSIQKLKDAVDDAKPNLPDEADDPIVSEINFNDFPIVTYSFVGNYTDIELQNYAEILQSEFETIKAVSKAPLIGDSEREFQVIVDQTKLAAYKVTIKQLISAINLTNFNLPAGEVTIDDNIYNLRVKGKIKNIDDLNSVVIKYNENSPVYLRNIAAVNDTFKDKKTKSIIGIGKESAKNTISIQLFKKTGGNILKIADNADKVIEKLKQTKQLPVDLIVLKTNDNSVFIKNDISSLGKSGLQTILMIILLLFVVLGWRGAIITGLSIPIAFLIAFIVLMLQGMTINSMVLFSLVLSLGLMVDNAIIIMEGINEYLYKHNKTPKESAILAVWNYRWPIIAGTLTTVGAFLPMLLVSGIMGEYIGILPKTITATLLSSLVVALVIIPALAAKFYKKHNESDNKEHRSNKIRNQVEKLHKYYTKILSNILPNKKKRRNVILVAFILLILTVALPVTGLMKIEMFPKIDVEYFIVNLKMPVGTTLEQTASTLNLAEIIVKDIPEIDNYISTVGSSFAVFAGHSGSSAENLGSIIVNLKKSDEREFKSYEIVQQYRQRIESLPGGDFRLDELSAGPPSEAPIQLKVKGYDLKVLSKTAKKIQDLIIDTPNAINIRNDIEESSGDFTYSLDTEKLKYYGLSTAEVATIIRQAIYGIEASSVTIDGDDVDILIKYNKNKIQSVEDLKNILIPTPKIGFIKVSQIATLSIEPSVLNITHQDGEKVVKISGDTTKDGDVRKIMANIEDKLKDFNLPSGYSIEYGGEMIDIQKSFTEMFMSMFLAVFIIIFILVTQFNSFKKPLVIMFSLPLAIVGAFFGLLVLRLPFSLPAFIGIISLAGIVVNDSIVLLDRISKNLKRGMKFYEGVIEAGVARMQPIFLTSITTIVGVLPLALSEEMWRGLGFSLIFGLIFATVLTLFFIPVVFTCLCRKDYNIK